MTPRRAIITGASSLLGLEFARQLGEHCDELVLCGRQIERLEQAANMLDSSACRSDIITADLSTTIGIAHLVETIRQRGPFDYLINNAESAVFGPFSKQAPPSHDTMIGEHIQATLQLTLAALAGMQQAGSGYIVNVSSLAALEPAGGAAVYGASKAFLNNFSEALQQEVSGQGIKIQCLCPGFDETSFQLCDPAGSVDTESAPDASEIVPETIVSQSLGALHGNRQQVVLLPGERNQNSAGNALNGQIATRDSRSG